MDSVVILAVAGVIVIGLGLLAVVLLSRRGNRSLDKEKYQQDWLAIEQSMQSDSASQQFAVLQADKLLDRALKDKGFKGQTMGERMTSASRLFSKRGHVWAAHKLRNRIAHESNVKLSDKLARQALVSFKRALRDIGAV